jgi:hypothetical protein
MSILILNSGQKKTLSRIMFFAVLVPMIVGLIALLKTTNILSGVAGLRELNSILDFDLDTIAMIFDHKANISERASYGVVVDTSSLTNVLITTPLVLLHYFLQPFPQNIANLYDFVAFIEVTVRVSILCYLYKNRRFLSKENCLLLFFYCAAFFLWAVGTTNWGTAQRHHITTNWMLILLYIQCRYGSKFTNWNKN